MSKRKAPSATSLYAQMFHDAWMASSEAKYKALEEEFLLSIGDTDLLRAFRANSHDCRTLLFIAHLEHDLPDYWERWKGLPLRMEADTNKAHRPAVEERDVLIHFADAYENAELRDVSIVYVKADDVDWCGHVVSAKFRGRVIIDVRDIPHHIIYEDDDPTIA